MKEKLISGIKICVNITVGARTYNQYSRLKPCIEPLGVATCSLKFDCMSANMGCQLNNCLRLINSISIETSNLTNNSLWKNCGTSFTDVYVYASNL